MPKPQFTKWLEEREEIARKNFYSLYANWHGAVAMQHEPDLVGDAEVAQAAHTTDEAARLLMITPATQPWMIWWKWEVLEFYMSDGGECGWTDERQWAFLACIKADLMRFGIAVETHQ